MRVTIVGAGAVGGYFGAHLARAGRDLTFVTRGEHGRCIRDHGLTIETPDERFTARGEVFQHIHEARPASADVALIAVKTYQLSDVAVGVGAVLASTGVAIPLLNGLDSERELAAVLGPQRVIGATAFLSARIICPGSIAATGRGSIALAALVPEQDVQVKAIAEAFSQAFPCTAEPDLESMLWKKLLWNVPFNAVCGLCRLTVGDVLRVPQLEKLLRDTMLEVITVARAHGVNLPESLISPILAATLRHLSQATPSMLQDLLSRRRTEVDALQGAVVRRGEQAGVPTPINRTLLALLRGQEFANAI